MATQTQALPSQTHAAIGAGVPPADPAPGPPARPPGHVPEGDGDADRALMRDAAVKRGPDHFGKEGAKVRLVTNCFWLDFMRDPETGKTSAPNQISCYHFDIRITDSQGRAINSRNVNRKVFQRITDRGFFNPMKPAYDGVNNVYTPHQLREDSYKRLETDLKVTAIIDDLTEPDGREFTFRMTFIKRLSLADLFPLLRGDVATPNNESANEVLAALNTILKHGTAQRFPSNKRSYFLNDANFVRDLTGGLQLRKGYFAQLRISEKSPLGGGPRLLVNIDTASSAFFASPNVPPIGRQFVGNFVVVCLEVLGVPRRDIFNAQGQLVPSTVDMMNNLDAQARRKIVSRFRNIKIEMKRGDRDRGQVKRFADLSLRGANQETFMDENGERITVQTFFQRHWARSLVFPKLPCLRFGRRLVPMELCRVKKDQRMSGKLNPAQMQEALALLTSRTAELRPDARFHQAQAGRDRTDEMSGPTLADYKLQLAPRLLELEGRVLASPTLLLGGAQSKYPTNGAWNMAGDIRVFSPANFGSWAVLDFAGLPDGGVRSFCTELVSRIRRMGLGAPQQEPPIVRPSADQGDFRKWIRRGLHDSALAAMQVYKNRGPDMILVILKGKPDNPLYHGVKSEGDGVAAQGCAVQCVIADQVQKAAKGGRGTDQYLGNLGLKINLKLGGINFRVQNFPIVHSERRVMVVGADVSHVGTVTHPKPSIVGVVASMDQSLGKFHATVRAQELVEPSDGATVMRPRRQEPIVELKEIMVVELERFKERNHKYPDHLLYYRDGVSEGEYNEVLVKELGAIRDAFVSVGARDEVKVTFSICGKRHHIRFRPVNEKDADKTGNCKAGTVVDQGINHPYRRNYYLQSQAGLLGTSRPCHYEDLIEEGNYRVDDLQKLAWYLANNFQRSTRSVSIVAPAYYADIVAARARMWVNEPDDGSSHGADLSVPQTPEDRQRDLESFRSTIKDKLIKLKELTPAMRKEGRVPMADRMWFL